MKGMSKDEAMGRKIHKNEEKKVEMSFEVFFERIFFCW